MRNVLVVDDEPLVAQVISFGLEELADTEVVCMRDGAEAGQRLLRGDCDLAIIDAILPNISGIVLAEIAANLNIPALLLAGHPNSIETLAKFDFPFLAKPFPLDELVFMTLQIISDKQIMAERIKASAAKMRASGDALTDAMVVSRQLVEASRRLLDRS